MNLNSIITAVMAQLLFTTSIVKADTYKSCVEDQTKYLQRSAEIQKIVDLDQKDRSNHSVTPDVQKRDNDRRKRIGAIFGEGCFKSAKDYANAALVFQHGDRPDHFFQTFIWAKRAVELGDSSQKRLMALAIDRYLVNTGHKQLFASQAYKEGASPCWCLQEVESTFPKKLRIEYMGSSLQDQEDWVDSLNKGKECKKKNYCRQNFLDSPSGSIPGFW